MGSSRGEDNFVSKTEGVQERGIGGPRSASRKAACSCNLG